MTRDKIEEQQFAFYEEYKLKCHRICDLSGFFQNSFIKLIEDEYANFDDMTNLNFEFTRKLKFLTQELMTFSTEEIMKIEDNVTKYLEENKK